MSGISNLVKLTLLTIILLTSDAALQAQNGDMAEGCGPNRRFPCLNRNDRPGSPAGSLKKRGLS